MIITRTPLRISLVGGGTDMPAFYKRRPGAVVSFTIDKYIYVLFNPKFDEKLRVSYSRTENVGHPLELKHDIIRESMLSSGVYSGEIVTVADIPGEGTGLGSSSALAVGLTRALQRLENSYLAEHAYQVEREQCLHPVGKQDHYAAAFGGLNFFQFNPDGSVQVEKIDLDQKQREELESHCVLLWTDQARNANDILKIQEANLMSESVPVGIDMYNLAVMLRDKLRTGDFSMGEFLSASWTQKKKLAYNISNPWLEMIYGQAILAGAQGGKVCGAGGGGFMLFYGEPGLGPKLEQATGLKQMPFKIEMEGCKTLYE